MATRAERLNERLRGAQRVNVDLDESFSLDLDIPAFDIPGLNNHPKVPEEASTPTGASTRNSDAPGSRRSQASRDPYELPDTSKESVAHVTKSAYANGRDERGERNVPPSTVRPANTTPQGGTHNGTAKTVSRIISGLQIGSDKASPMDTITTSPADADMVTPADAPPSSVSRIIASLQINSAGPEELPPSSMSVEEIEESPPNMPGSGRRRTVAVTPIGVLVSSPERQASSPLDRKSTSNRSIWLGRRTKTPRRSMQEVLPDDVDELSPDGPVVPSGRAVVRSARRVSGTPLRLSKTPDDDVDELSPDRPLEVDGADNEFSEAEIEVPTEPSGEPVELLEDKEPNEQYQPPLEDDPTQLEEPEQAEEITATEAAKTLGRKRPRASLRASSPELGSFVGDEVEELEEPVPKRKRGRPSKSHAQQKQPAPKEKPKRSSGARIRASPAVSSQAKASKVTKQKEKPRKSKSPTRERGGEQGNVAFEVTVQHITNPPQSTLPLPHANRSAVSPIDVFSQLCTEVISNTLSQFQTALAGASDPAKKKEFRVKIRAVEAYREELGARLLTHAVHLNNWHTLRKRVREVQREKVALREEILRLRGEREGVALRMDAVRGRFEIDDKEASFLLNTSSTMRDIDKAVAQGQAALELVGKAGKEAELANLELVVSQVSEQVSNSDNGGMLSELIEFNTFLERAALALETR